MIKKYFLLLFVMFAGLFALNTFAQTTTRPSETQIPIAVRPVASVTQASVPSVPATLRPGMANAEVTLVQSQLREQGLYNGTVDGKYGPQTKAAVERFQAAQGLKVDGIAGTQTLSKLSSPNAAAVSPTSNNAFLESIKTTGTKMSLEEGISRMIEDFPGNAPNCDGYYSIEFGGCLYIFTCDGTYAGSWCPGELLARLPFLYHP